MFKFNPKVEDDIFRRLDELRVILDLPSRGHVVELSIRQLWSAAKVTQVDVHGSSKVALTEEL